MDSKRNLMDSKRKVQVRCTLYLSLGLLLFGHLTSFILRVRLRPGFNLLCKYLSMQDVKHINQSAT